jgi:hypothetical protein
MPPQKISYPLRDAAFHNNPRSIALVFAGLTQLWCDRKSYVPKSKDLGAPELLGELAGSGR